MGSNRGVLGVRPCSISVLTIAIAFFISTPRPSPAARLFESRCEDLAAWEVLDLSGNGQASLEEDPSVPSAHGPEVLSLKGKELLLFAKAPRIETGTILTLWKDVEPLENDSDGVIFFGADYPDDLEVARNLKEKRTHSWIEEDSDEGFQIKTHRAGDERETIVSTLPGIGLTQAEWNLTGWIWQKLILSKDGLRAKYWAHGTPEPAWTIHLPDWKPSPGRVGLAIHSGHAKVAYFAVSEEDISPDLPEITVSVSQPVCYSRDKLAVTVVMNLKGAVPSARLTLSLLDQEKQVWSQETTRSLPQGNTVIVFSGLDNTLPLPQEVAHKPHRLLAHLSCESPSLHLETEASIEFRDASELDLRISELESKTKENLERLRSKGGELTSIQENASAARHLRLARERLASGQIGTAEMSIAYAEEAFETWRSLPRLSCRSTALSAASLVMGETYTVRGTWTSEPWYLPRLGFATSGGPDPDMSEPRTARLVLTDDLGLEEVVSQEAVVQPEDWEKDGQTLFRFRLPEEFPKGSLTPIANPAVREGWHRVWISLKRPDGSPEWLDMPKPNCGDFQSRYEIARVYITQNPVEIGPIEARVREDQGLEGLQFSLRNPGPIQFSGELTVTLLSECGNPIRINVQQVHLQKKWPVSIELPILDLFWFGKLKARIEVTRAGRLVTCAEKEIHVPAPEGWPIESVLRGSQVVRRGPDIETPLVFAPQLETDSGRVEVEVRQCNRLLEEAKLSFQSSHKIESPSQTLLVEPIVGTYHVKISTRCQDGKVWSRELPIIGTVVTNNSGVLEMNGEPFIVKGVNVHGMISDSPERNRHLQRFLKDIGFNMLRGDYPPPWQVEMAGEENIGYMVLAPFSVTHTDLLKERHGERAFPEMREVSRRFIRTYRDLPAVWLWNSCNEIEGELDDFLVTLHPLYRALDPADRPVVYANLFGQDRTLGMDVMAVNYYYGPPQMARDRWPLIQRSIEESRKAKVPCIYTEYNCWYGPVYSRGVESVEDFFVKGIEWGMQGGFQFMLPDHPDRHPGVIDTRERLRTNPTYLASLKDAFADAELEPVSRERGSILLSIRNRRPFTLRKVRYRIEELGRVLAEGELRDIEPHGSGRIPRILDKGGEGRILQARIDFETHHGLRCKVEDELRLPAAQR